MSSRKNVNFRDMISAHSEEQNNGLNVLEEYKSLAVEELKEIQESEQFPFHVLFFNLTGELNVGSMIRNACLSGAQKVWIFGRRRFDRRGMVGANNYIDIEQVEGFTDDDDSFVEFSVPKLKELLVSNNLVPIYAELGGQQLGQFNWKPQIDNILSEGMKPCLIMGNENSGFPDDVHDFFKSYKNAFCVSIPQRGVMRSFNVGHAMSAILWDMRKDCGWF